MSFLSCSSQQDTFIERDIEAGKLTESEAQELIDQVGGWADAFWAKLLSHLMLSRLMPAALAAPCSCLCQ